MLAATQSISSKQIFNHNHPPIVYGKDIFLLCFHTHTLTRTHTHKTRMHTHRHTQWNINGIIFSVTRLKWSDHLVKKRHLPLSMYSPSFHPTLGTAHSIFDILHAKITTFCSGTVFFSSQMWPMAIFSQASLSSPGNKVHRHREKIQSDTIGSPQHNQHYTTQRCYGHKCRTMTKSQVFSERTGLIGSQH